MTNEDFFYIRCNTKSITIMTQSASIPEKYKKEIQDTEKVIWFEKIKTPEGTKKHAVSIFILAGVALLLVSILILINNIEAFGMLFTFLSVIIAMSYVGLNFIFTNNTYIATDDRIIHIKEGFSKNKTSYYYKNIYQIRLYGFGFGNEIVLIQSPSANIHFEENQNIPRIAVSSPHEKLNQIQDAWFSKSPHQNYMKDFENIAKKYHLNFTPFHYSKNNYLKLDGEINGMKTSFSLGKIFMLQTLNISIECPNSKNNYLMMKPETIGTGFQKITGTQDLKVGYPTFDDKFLLQSNDRRFFDTIIDKKIQKQLLISRRSIKGDFIFGQALVKKKENTKEDLDILDAHLLDPKNRIQKINKGQKNSFSFSCKNLFQESLNANIILKHSILLFETMIDMAQKIQEYEQ